MSDRADILISVKGRFIDNMLTGTKRVELRRRAPRISPGTRIWIYEKAPVATVRAVAILAKVETMAPEILWSQYGSTLGLSYQEYQDYIAGSEHAAALSLERVAPLRPISLRELRELRSDFHPPQFYLRLEASGILVSTLEQHLYHA